MVGLRVEVADPFATLWLGETFIDLHPTWARRSEAVSVNSIDEAVGYAYRLTGGQRGVLWRDGKAIDLGDFGGGQSRAYDVNDLSQAVGWGTDSLGITNGFIWESGNLVRLVDLLKPGHNLGFAWGQAINNASQVLSIGGEVGSTGAAHWYVLNPVPEPSPAIIIGMGLMALTFSRRKERRG